MDKINLLLVDDHQMIRDGLRLMLKKIDNVNVVGEANDGNVALEYLNKNDDVDVVLMDINMPGMDGIETTKAISKRYDNVNVLALTMHIEERYISAMVDSGAKGYILKESTIDELTNAITSVAAGKKYFSNEVSITLINSLMNNPIIKRPDLTERELEVLSLLVKGKTNSDISEDLHISSRTVETHRRNIIDKLNVKNTAGLVAYALKNKLVV